MDARDPLGSVARLWRYPVKSLPPEARERIEIARDGVVGDRRRALFVASPGHVRFERAYRGKENRLLHTVPTIERARGLAAAHDIDVAERRDGPYFDAEPISIVVDRWVHGLEAMLDVPLDPQRFRPNIYVRAAPGFAAEETELVGRTLVVGRARLEVVSTIKRCVTITYDVETGEASPLIARTLAERRDNVMGVYCRPLVPGAVSLGDYVLLSGAG